VGSSAANACRLSWRASPALVTAALNCVLFFRAKSKACWQGQAHGAPAGVACADVFCGAAAAAGAASCAAALRAQNKPAAPAATNNAVRIPFIDRQLQTAVSGARELAKPAPTLLLRFLRIRNDCSKKPVHIRKRKAIVSEINRGLTQNACRCSGHRNLRRHERGERASAGIRARQNQSPLMRFGNPSRDRESQPRPAAVFFRTCPRFIYAEKPLEHLLPELRGYPRPGVCDAKRIFVPARSQDTATRPPLGVYLMALSSKFKIIRRSKASSPRTSNSSGTSQVRVICFAKASERVVCVQSATSSSK